MNLWRRLRGPRTTDTPPGPTTTPSEPEVRDLGDDPLDPHGDGTIEPGDPMWDIFTSGRPMIVNRRADGQWDVHDAGEGP